MTLRFASGIALSAFLAFSTPGRAEITIAVAGPMTGDYAPFGLQMKAGAEQAIADINASGGVNGEQVKLVIEDDACNPSQARSVAERLASRKVALVAGHFCSGSSIPASEVYFDEGILQISPASTNPDFTEKRRGPGIYRVCGRDDAQGTVAGKYMAENYKGKNVAILNDKSAYGKGLADETAKAMNAAGLKEVINESYTAGQGAADYLALVSKLKLANIDAVYIGGYHKEAGLILRQMRDQGLQAQMISGDALNSKQFWEITGDAGEGMMFTFSPDPRKLPTAADIVKKFEAKKIDPEGYTLYTYAAVQVWKAAVTEAKSIDTKKIIPILDKNNFDTVLGSIKFDGKGDVTDAAYVFYKWKNGDYSQM